MNGSRSDFPVKLLDFRRLFGLVYKESVQILRDPSALLIAFVLPGILLFLFANAISLDVEGVRIGLVVEDDSATVSDLASFYTSTPFFEVQGALDRRKVEDRLISGDLRGLVVIPQGFGRAVASGGEARPPQVQIITDGSQPNTANFVAGYAEGALATWMNARQPAAAQIVLEDRVWFNPEVESRRFLVPSSIAIVMTMIGTLLTALVVAREWERGTMEALFSTPAGIFEILVGKLLPYFGLGLLATLGCTLMAIYAFDVPLRGSWTALLALASAFLVPALGQGLLISAVTRNQFVASQLALLSGFLPAFLLSGFLFQIESMPRWIQYLTTVVPAKYFVSSLQTVFLAGDVWPVFRSDIVAMLGLGLFFFAVTTAKTRRSLD